MTGSEFFHMGGYAAYVWPSYALGLIVLLANLWVPWRRRRQVLRDLGRNLHQERKS